MAKLKPFIDMSDVAEKLNKIERTFSTCDVVLDRTLKDMHSRAPGKVASAVTKVYNIKKGEITPSKKTDKKLAGGISTKGETLSTFEILYSGRPLTLTHFGFSPKSVPEKRNYKFKTKIRKMGEKAKSKTENNKSDPFILKSPQGIIMPFQRRLDKLNSKNSHYKKKDGTDGRGNQMVISMRTDSLPQMVDDEIVRKILGQGLSDLLKKRLDNHLNQHLKKNL